MAERATIDLASEGLSARVDPLGAELTHLRDAQGRELMTDADPAFWTGHAPILFPIVGALNGGTYRLDGREYALPQHGFARRRLFDVVEQAADHVVLRLSEDAETRAVYPFAFDLTVEHRLSGTTLETRSTVANTGDAAMPFSFGHHPAFAWPLPYGAPREDHRIVFDRDEAPCIARLQGGLLAGTDRPSPLDGRTLSLDDALFRDDALIWEQVNSTSATYGAATGPALRIDFAGFPGLGIWTKPGARFVCIEPWQGHADPVGFAGDFRDKPGIVQVEPGASRSFVLRVTLQR